MSIKPWQRRFFRFEYQSFILQYRPNMDDFYKEGLIPMGEDKCVHFVSMFLEKRRKKT